MKSEVKRPTQMRGLTGLLEFLEYLQRRKIWYTLAHLRNDSIMVTFTLVGYRVEVDFFDSGVEFSIFTGSEDVFTEEADLFALIDRVREDE
ncbi:MAG: hypothetical protein ACRCXM_06795 [Beijerinckiaceae bacterium]